MHIARSVAAAIVAHARAEAPRECCGLLIGTTTEIVDAVASGNLAEPAETRYLVDPRVHLRAMREARDRGLQVVGAYHSHPRSPAAPSATDAAEGFAQFLFVIVGLGSEPAELTAWSWADGNFTAVPLVRLP
jgi:proteasome lid subunit RPN8/RPN11